MTELFQRYEVVTNKKILNDKSFVLTFSIIDKMDGQDAVGERFAFIHQAQAVAKALNGAFYMGMIEVQERVLGRAAPSYNAALKSAKIKSRLEK
ncbi:MAG: hypothetical protein FVQ79_04195 [Planctomycetes bacterium]|nr:hypothetical protein [Planctomycetota bacterium]